MSNLGITEYVSEEKNVAAVKAKQFASSEENPVKNEVVVFDSNIDEEENLNQVLKIEKDRINELDKTIENDLRKLKKLEADYEQVKANPKGYMTKSQDKTLCIIGGVSMALGTIGTFLLDKKLDAGGMLGLFSCFGLAGGALLTLVTAGITRLFMMRNNCNLSSNIEALRQKIADEQAELEQLRAVKA